MRLKYDDFSFDKDFEGFTNKVRTGLFEYTLVFSEELSKNIGFGLDLAINLDLLDQVIVDAIEDLRRLVDFHPTEKPNTIKEVAYIAYWWLKRKPLIINDIISKLKISPEEKVKLIFVNEHFLLAYIEQRIFDFGEDIKCKSTNVAEFEAQWKQARGHILYFLAYRALSAQSIEAFIVTSTLHPVRALTDNFWL